DCDLKAFTEIAAIVMDIGTGYTKAGFAGDDKPRVVLRSLVGIPIHQPVHDHNKGPDYYIGNSIPNDPWITKTRVVTNGIVTDWDALEMLWHYVFYQELRVAPEEHAILLSDAPLSPITNREKSAELLFEGFGVPALFIAHQTLLSLYSTGRTTGLIIESGLGKCKEGIHSELLNNIVLSGGSSMFPGFAERIQKEIGKLAPNRSKLNVYASPQRKFSSLWVRKKDYEEEGSVIVHRKCF
uniref:Uncharacterized protein n=1 Tax=Callorhinchus milii TaxID=7868 RepID=A0A4W3GND5_CALMI